MNDASLAILENTRLKKLEEHQLDEKSISEFKSVINQVDEETKQSLGKDLFDLLSKVKTLKKNEKDFNGELDLTVFKLITHGADIEYKDERKGDFPLLLCARKGLVRIAYLLLRAGANVNQTNNYSTTALMAAARHGHKELVEVLILLGADINAKCLDGDNALMSAKRHSQQECFDVLVHAQSSLNHRNLANQTVMDLTGHVSLNPNYLISSKEENTPPTTEEDVSKLLEAAEQRLLKFTNKQA